MNAKRSLAGVLALLQILWSCPTESFAQVVVQGMARTQAPVTQIAPVPVNLSLPAGGITSSLDANLDPALPNFDAGILPSLVTPDAALTAPQARVQAAAGVQAAGMDVQATLAAPKAVSQTPHSPGQEAGISFESAPGNVGKVSAKVRKALSLPELGVEAPAEGSKLAADDLFAALRGESLIRGSGAPQVRALPNTLSNSRARGAASRPFQLHRAAERFPEQITKDTPLPKQPAGPATSIWRSKAAKIAGAVLGAVGVAAALPFLSPYVGMVAATGSVILSVIGVPQIYKNFKMGKEGVKDLAIASPLIWFAAATMLSVTSIGQGASLWWNVANLAGVAESAMVVGQINYYKRSPKALKATILTALATLAPVPLIFGSVLMPMTSWLSLAFTAAMSLLWVLNWPQMSQNFKLYQTEKRPPAGIAPLYPALVAIGSLLHLYAAIMGGDIRWAMNAVIGIVTTSLVLGQIYFPKATNKLLGPVVKLTEKLLALPKKLLQNHYLGAAEELVAKSFAGRDLSRFAATAEQREAQLAKMAEMAKDLPGRSMIVLEAPTAAGKSTLAKRLESVLAKQGKKLKSLEVDRYFKNIQDIKLGLNGTPDFDRPDSLLMDRVAGDIRTLLAGGRIELPAHDMATGKTSFETGEYMELAEDEILVVDSIFASDEKILNAAEGHRTLNVFLFAPTIIRLARRLARDKVHRGTSIRENLRRWRGILNNEAEFILPLAEKAHFVMNLVGELELSELQKAYAELLAEDWAVNGKDDKATELFRRMLEASLDADK